MEPVIVILGPTSAGKTAASVQLAKAVKGEIISADSRQVYRGLDIGTGKVTRSEMKGIPHHLLDVADPRKVFSASEFVRLGRKAISEIRSRGSVPIIAGGTGFYIDALLGTIPLPDVSPNTKLRKELAKKDLKWLRAKLTKLDPARAKTIDVKNPVRLIRAIEIATALGKVPKIPKKKLYDVLYLGISPPPVELKKKIHTRLLARIRTGMLTEARILHRKGLSWKRMEELGLEYRCMARHLQGAISKPEMLRELESEIVRYAKRQMTWFKKNNSVRWVSSAESKKIIAETKRFLNLRNKAV